MEALTAASIAALTIYDMLKPYCEPAELCIRECRLDEKRGGKSQYKRQLPAPVAAAVLVLSDTVAAGRKPDTADRKRVVEGKSGSVRVALGGRRTIKKKKK